MAQRIMSGSTLLRVSLGLFLIVIGIFSLMNKSGVNLGIFALNVPKGNSQEMIHMIFAVVELLCGFLILSGLFLFGSSRAVSMGSTIVFVFWIARIVLVSFLWTIKFGDKGITFVPNFNQWLFCLVANLVVLAALATLSFQYE